MEVRGQIRSQRCGEMATQEPNFRVLVIKVISGNNKRMPQMLWVD